MQNAERGRTAATPVQQSAPLRCPTVNGPPRRGLNDVRILLGNRSPVPPGMAPDGGGLRLLRNHHSSSSRSDPPQTGALLHDGRPYTIPSPWRPPNPGKMWNSSPSATFRSTFPPVSGQNAERNALRAPTVPHFPRFPGKMWNSSPAAVFRSTFSPGGEECPSGQPPSTEAPPPFLPIRPLRDRGGEA